MPKGARSYAYFHQITGTTVLLPNGTLDWYIATDHEHIEVLIPTILMIIVPVIRRSL